MNILHKFYISILHKILYVFYINFMYVNFMYLQKFYIKYLSILHKFYRNKNFCHKFRWKTLENIELSLSVCFVLIFAVNISAVSQLKDKHF